MPLPDGSTAWPPAHMAPIFQKQAEWSAWFSNDYDTLARHYGGFSGRSATIPRPRSSQYAGGVVGTVSRWFWGAPVDPITPAPKLHVPLASDIATASSDLLFAESVTITLPDELKKSQPAQDRLQLVLDGVQWDSLLPEQGELCSALGGVYSRIVWDTEVEPRHPLLSFVHADQAVPEYGIGGRLLAVTFWQVLDRKDSGETWRVLERHSPGRIEYGLYHGSDDKLGRREPLEERPETASLAKEVDGNSEQLTKYAGMTARYIPNIRPSRLWRRHPVGANLGRADIEGIEPLLDAADETMTSWLRDVRLGKGRIIVPQYMLEYGGLGRGHTFNVDREVFVGLNSAPPGEEGGAREITSQQFAIRTAEHADTMKGILSAAFRGAGYSSQTFGLSEEGAPTATEVNAREGRSARTYEKKSRYQGTGLEETLEALLAIDALHFGGGLPVGIRPSVTFPPAGRPDPEAQARSLQMLRAAQLVSIDTGVRMTHPDWEDEDVRAEVARIVGDAKALTPASPFDPLGAEPGTEGGGDPDEPVELEPVE